VVIHLPGTAAGVRWHTPDDLGARLLEQQAQQAQQQQQQQQQW
jgi:hypothetical protein